VKNRKKISILKQFSVAACLLVPKSGLFCIRLALKAVDLIQPLNHHVKK